jgi:RNA polymerase sigma-70 factor (ECF subfamily)
VLLLRDVVGLAAAEVASLLETSVASVTSALQRARVTMRRRFPDGERDAPSAALDDGLQRALLERYVRAWEEGDLRALVALLREDVVVSMPPDALWFRGRDAFARFAAATILAEGTPGHVRLLPVAANGQPAFALYQRDHESGEHRALAIMVLTLDGDRVAEITGFMDPSAFPRFGVEPALRD